jgi:hypothetical protein
LTKPGIRTLDIEGTEIACFFREYDSDDASKRAYERADKASSTLGDVSVMRTFRLDSAGNKTDVYVIAVVGPPRDVRRLHERVAWGGTPAELSEQEVLSFVERHVNVHLDAEAPGTTRIRHGKAGSDMLRGGRSRPRKTGEG